jgi:hypothetical protein
MGVEYYIFDRLNKTFYDLGKGPWYHLDVELIADLEMLKEWITTVCFEECGLTTKLWIDERIAPDLHRLFGQTPPQYIGIVNDCGDDLCEMKFLGYRCLGTRYFDKNSQEYVDYLMRSNRHLTDPVRRLLYEVPLTGRY